jgi:hypothetical protein
MVQMVRANVPGVYVFHRAEEVGGRGSRYVATHSATMLQNIRAAIAFDRRGTKEVITHQGWSRCCSDDFANALCDGLRMGLKPSPHGIFTDTANYVDHIGECTNISVGYDHEHSAQECLDVGYLVYLLQRLTALDTDTLPNVRKPGEREPIVDYWADYQDGATFYRHPAEYNDGRAYGSRRLVLPARVSATLAREEIEENSAVAEIRRMGWPELMSRYPDAIADILDSCGVQLQDAQDEIISAYGLSEV